MRSMRIWSLLVGAVMLWPARAAAQDYRFGASYNAGGVYFTPLNSNAANVGGGAATDLELSTGWIIGLQFEQWIGGGRLGWRLNGALTERPLTLPGEKRDIGIWLADFDLLLRLLSPDPDRIVAPYISVGAGAIQYRLGDGDLLAIENADALYEGDDAPLFAAAGGLGFDILTTWTWGGEPVGIRIEVVDHVALDSPFKRLSGGDFSPIHNVRLVVGAFTGFGVLR